MSWKEKTCSGCEKKELLTVCAERLGPPRSKTGHRSTIYIYEDKRGARWSGNFCYECAMSKIRKQRGTRPRLESKNPLPRRAVEVELKAKAFFERVGCKVRHGHGVGPDLFVRRGGGPELTVEVKPVQKTKSGSYFVSKVKPARMNDNWIAIVLPNGRVVLDDMQEHLKKCGKAGYRTVTALVKEKGM